MSRVVAEDLKNISIYFFKKHGLLQVDGFLRMGEMTWSRRGEVYSRISYAVSYNDGMPTSIQLSYTAADTGKSYNPKLTTSFTECNYGGKRYWLMCPNCHERCAKVYLYNYLPYCRKCLNLTYEVNNESKKYRYLSGCFGSAHSRELEERLQKTGRYYYAGKPTKTYNAYLCKPVKDIDEIELYKL